MLLITAMLSIILGMGMPSTAIYIILASIIAPALVDMGIPILAAHFFIFYFGVLSFLTPPVAVSSFVAAGLAECGHVENGLGRDAFFLRRLPHPLSSGSMTRHS